MSQQQILKNQQDVQQDSQAKVIRSGKRTPAQNHSALDTRDLIGNHGVLRTAGEPLIQAKLKIGEPNDAYEQEADRVADAVIRMPDPLVQRKEKPDDEDDKIQMKPVAGQITPLVQRKGETQHRDEDDEDEPIQMKDSTSQDLRNSQSAEAPPIVHEALRSPGQPLDQGNRTFFESRFKQDLSHVRVHTDPIAAQAARTIHASAFTSGSDIAFAAGKHQLDTTTGQQLLAHELVHIIQQNKKSKPGNNSSTLTETGNHALQRFNDFNYMVEKPTKTASPQKLNESSTGVYICYVPLSVFPKFVPSNTLADHAFIQFDDGWSAGFTIQDEEQGKENKPKKTKKDARIHIPEPRRNDPRKVVYSTERKEDSTSQSKTSAEIKQAIKTYAQTVDPGRYNLVTNNCGNWVQKAFNASFLKPNTPWHLY
jgi:hypothetical protein